MKRKLNDALPPAKKRKLDDPHDPSVIVPKLKVSSVSNGIVEIEFINIDSFYEQEIANNTVFQFELMYKNNNSEWRRVRYLNHEISCYEYFYLKVLVDIKDYTLDFKLRSKLKTSSEDQWSPFCDNISIQIKSSLIAHQFKVGDYVEFRDKNEYYSREGKIIKILPDDMIKIRPFSNHWIETNDDENVNDDEYIDDDNDILMNVLQRIDGNNDDDDDDDDDDDINIHTSRLYGDGIRLLGVVDISNNQMNVDKMILLTTNDDKMMIIYNTLNGIFSDYAIKYVKNYNNFDHFDDNYQLKYIGRFIGKNVMDFLLPNNNRFKWKIKCLRESNDGRMRLNGVRSDIISARIDGLKDKIDGIKLYDIDNIIGFCDICRLEISDFDWRFNCDQHITNKHDICMTCTYNIIQQYIQLNNYLYPLLKNILNDDCIQEITNFVVGSLVKL